MPRKEAVVEFVQALGTPEEVIAGCTDVELLVGLLRGVASQIACPATAPARVLKVAEDARQLIRALADTLVECAESPSVERSRPAMATDDDLHVSGCGSTLNASGMLLNDGSKVPDGVTATCVMPVHAGEHCGWLLGRLVSWAGPFKVTLSPEADHG